MSADAPNGGDPLSEELVARYMELRARDLAESKAFYFRELMPALRRYLEAVPEYQQLRARSYDTLVSLMGYSPETTVISATILRPKRLIVAYSGDEQAKRAAFPALNYLTSEGIVDPLSVEHIAVDAFDPDDIYRKLRARIPTEGSLVFDITGGTKVMSATAGSLAWELNLTLCYLDGAWDPRSGSSGLKNAARLRLIRNPSRQKGHEVRRAALEFYRQGNYVAAQAAFGTSRSLIDDSFFDQVAWQLCDCYQALADLDGPRLERCVAALREGQNVGGFAAVAAAIGLSEQVEALDKLSRGDGLTRLAAFLELGAGYRTQARYDFSCLLFYRAMESTVELGLKRLNPAFRTDAPDYSLLGDPAEIAKQFRFEPNVGKILPAKLAFLDAFQLLCIVDRAHERFAEPQSFGEACKTMMAYASLRNQSNLAHGSRTLTADNSSRLDRGAHRLLDAVLPQERSAIDAARAALRPRLLESR